MNFMINIPTLMYLLKLCVSAVVYQTKYENIFGFRKRIYV